METKNIFLIGGSGNIGKLIIENFNDNYRIFILDKNKPKNLNLNKIKYIKCDLLKLKHLPILPRKIDVVIFLTGKTGGPDSLCLNNFKNYINYNCQTLINFLKITPKIQIKKIIYTSTEHIYGDNPKNTDKTKLFEPTPKNYYGVSKLLGEKILLNFCKKNNPSIDILRIPRVISHKVKNPISSMIESAKYKKRIDISNNKLNLNFIYFDDLMTFIISCINNKSKSGCRIFNVFNNSRPISLSKIAEIIKKKLNLNIKIKFSKSNYKIDHNPINLFISNKSSKKELKWEPKFDNRKIILNLIDKYEIKKHT